MLLLLIIRGQILDCVTILIGIILGPLCVRVRIPVSVITLISVLCSFFLAVLLLGVTTRAIVCVVTDAATIGQ